MSADPATSPPPPPAAEATPWRGLAGIALVHLAAFAYFMPARVLFSRDPIATIDYALHLYQTDRAVRAFRQHGELWSWDPLLLAGQPAGVVEDLTSKLTELWVIALTWIGVPGGVAFNSFIVVVHFAHPLLGWAAARAFLLSRRDAAVATGLWVALWWFDSFLHWSWWIGMITWAGASGLVVLLVALAWRGLRDASTARILAFCALLPVLALLHPFAGLSLALPLAVVWIAAARRAGWRLHALIAVGGLLAAATALVWIRPLLAFRHYVLDVDVFFNTTLEYLVFDTFDLVRDGRNTGVPVRTMFRTLSFVAAAACLVRWRRARDPRLLAVGALLGWTFFLAYVSGYSWHARQTQPYRQIGPAMLAAALPAAVVLRDLFATESLRSMGPRVKLLLALAAVLVVPRFARDVAYYVPELLPTRVHHSLLDRFTSPLAMPLEPIPWLQRHGHASPEQQAVRARLVELHGGRGRVLVSDWVLTEYLAATTRLPLLGGIPERNVPQVDSNLFRWGMPKGGAIPPAEVAPYLELWAIGWVVLDGFTGPLDLRRDLFEPVDSIGAYRIYRTRAEPSWLLRGEGRLVAQDLNLLRVEAARGSEIVLRHHYLEPLRCRPDCAVESVTVPGARVGFLRVPSPPPAFEIYNSYQLP
ncbi:MAG: hypothetical protein IT376_04625 [Polyangiaceae bacterium]|nr:hypothetical protein [Polyangiaceae bacterium]